MAGLLLSVALLVVNGLFVAGEFSLVATRRSRIEQLAEAGDVRAMAAQQSVSELSFMLSASQLGITVASLLLGYVAESSAAELLQGPLGDAGLSEGAAHTVGFVIGLGVVVFLHLVVGEIVPRSLAMTAPERAMLLLARPLRAWANLLRPVVHLLTGASRRILRMLGVEPRDELSEARTGEELADVLAVSRREGVLQEVEHRLMTRALRFPVREVSTVMVPRASIEAVPLTATAADVESVALASGHSRIVVHGRDLDEVLGFVHVKDLLGLPAASHEARLPRRLLRRMLVVPESRTLQDLLLGMRRARLHVAVVVDGEGHTAGMASLEDVLEALVGDIQDEHDTS